MSRWQQRCLLTLLLVCCASRVHAHKPSDSYLTLETHNQPLTGHWDLALRDLDRVLTLDGDADGNVTWGELRVREAEIVRTAFAQLKLQRAGQACPIEPGPLGVIEHSDGRYARLPFSAACQTDQGALSVRYDFFFALDPQHRGVVRVVAGASEHGFVLTAADRTLALSTTGSTQDSGVLALLGRGVMHILSGFDHVLFLLALLLPSVLRSSGERLSTKGQIRNVLRDVVKVVTAFTVAHSLTLGLAALGLVNMSASVIEPAIAASVAIAALDNLWPVFGQDRWSIAFVLGLLHGFGFSSALSDLGLHGLGLLRGLFAFNAGVELGQLVIVLLFVPLAFLLREKWAYRFVLFRGGSLAIAALSLVWFVERVRGG